MPRLSLMKCSLIVLMAGLCLTSATPAASGQCDQGYYSSTGLHPCTPCSPGSAQPNKGQTSCIPCAYGQYSSSVAARQCVKCPAGTIPAKGASTCVPSRPNGLGALSMSTIDFFTLAVDGAGIPWVFGNSFVFGTSGQGETFPTPIPLPDVNVDLSLDGRIGVPTTPAGATVIAASAGLNCGCLLYSDTSAGCFGDIGHVNLFSDFVNTNGYVTDGRTSTPLKGIRQIVASSAVNWQVSPSIVTSFRGILLLRDRKGFVTFLLNDGPGGNLVDSNNNVVDPLDPTRALQGAVEVAQGGAQACALMGPLYRRPNAVVCFAAAGVSYLGAKLTLDSTTFPFGPSLISVDGRSNYMRATSLSVGYVHTCATVGSAEVLCWGATVLGQLAGTPVDDITVTTSVISDAFGTAVAITTFDSGVQSVSCGGAHTCVVLTDADDVGVVRCWGNDGTGPTNSSSLSVYALNENVRYSDGSNRALTGVTSLSAGNAATCVTLGVNEAVTCWGADHVFSDAYGNVYDYAEYTLGDGGAAGRSDTGPKSGATTFKQLYPTGVVA